MKHKEEEEEEEVLLRTRTDFMMGLDNNSLIITDSDIGVPCQDSVSGIFKIAYIAAIHTVVVLVARCRCRRRPHHHRHHHQQQQQQQ
mmetsp:Transcript_59390/g.67243  ORF Transcript_59390/g.67243 Transcript_59390/m.67243 type:complete len:87 (+) Transcript_59390:523-783(+)